MPFMDLIKKAIFEEEPLAQQPAKPATSSGARPLEPAAPSYVPMGTRDNQFYTRLAKQTDLSAVPELAKIEAFAAPLASGTYVGTPFRAVIHPLLSPPT